jgi:hypothetical protein
VELGSGRTIIARWVVYCAAQQVLVRPFWMAAAAAGAVPGPPGASGQVPDTGGGGAADVRGSDSQPLIGSSPEAAARLQLGGEVDLRGATFEGRPSRGNS